jgi:hypothetical protein
MLVPTPLIFFLTEYPIPYTVARGGNGCAKNQKSCQRFSRSAGELELELKQTQMAQKSMPRAEMRARPLRASQNVKRAEVFGGARGSGMH